MNTFPAFLHVASRSLSRGLIAAFAIVALLSHAPRAHAQSTCLLKGPYVNNVPAAIYLDAGALYWSAKFIIPVGARVFLDAQYPHSRYMSHTTYAGASNITGLTDADISPNADGSVNPYVVGNARNLALRNYTVEFVAGNAPSGGGPANTLYSGTSDRSVTFLYRNYVPDNGQDATGGVGLPALRVVDANNNTLSGATACNAVQASNSPLVFPPMDLATYLAAQTVAPVTNPGTWGSTRIAVLASLFALQGQSLYPTSDNNYIETRLTRGLINKVIKVTGRVPTTPATFNGQTTMGSGQLRYWSLCMYEFATYAVTDCLNDVTITTDANGYYTIAVSRLADRPNNANPSCGKNWLQWSDAGAGIGGLYDPTHSDGMLVLRNMKANPSFTQDIGDLPLPINLVALPSAMGDYLPTATYMTTAGFEGLGC